MPDQPEKGPPGCVWATDADGNGFWARIEIWDTTDPPTPTDAEARFVSPPEENDAGKAGG